MQEKVHISIEVHYIAPDAEDFLLRPGQAFPVSTLPEDARQRYKGKLGKVELRVFASLWDGDRVYTDVSHSPLTRAYILREGLEYHAFAHSTKGGFGITIYDLDTGIPGLIADRQRTTAPYPLSLLLAHEKEAKYVKGPACHMHVMPETYMKLRPGATPQPGDVRRWDVWKGEVSSFRRFGLPLVLGSFESGRKPWQKVLQERYLSPSWGKAYELAGLIGSLPDPVTGESSGDTKGGPYEKYEYYLAYAVGDKPDTRPYHGAPRPRETVIVPYTKGDALAPIDLGRRRVFDWEEKILNFSYRRSCN